MVPGDTAVMNVAAAVDPVVARFRRAMSLATRAQSLMPIGPVHTARRYVGE